MKAMNKAIAVLTLCVTCTPVLAQQEWTWTGEAFNDPNWTTSANWDCDGIDCPPPPAFPDHEEAEVIIVDTSNDPVVNDVDNRNAYDVKSLELRPGAVLTLPVGDDCYANAPCMGLRLAGHDALKLSAGSKISIEGGFLELQGGGKLNIHADALIEFANTSHGRIIFSRASAQFGAPLYEIPGGSTNEVIRGSVHGIIVGGGGVGGGPSTLVLWDREITGSLTIFARLINNGRVVADESTHVITLACQPKGGSGLWKLDHSDARIIVEVPVTGTTQSEIEIINGILALADMWVTSGLLDWQGGSITTQPGDALIVGETVSCSN